MYRIDMPSTVHRTHEYSHPGLNLHLYCLEVSQRSSMDTVARMSVPRRAVRDLLALMDDAAGGKWAYLWVWWMISSH